MRAPDRWGNAQNMEQSSSDARIIVVDDDAGIRDVIRNYLSEHGYRVEAAANAKELEKQLSDAPADLIVLDVMMPGEDGLAVCRRLGADPGPGVIMLSALGEDADRIVGLELGADDYLAKPCNPRELLARVRAVLRRRRESNNGSGRGLTCTFAGWRLDLVRRELHSPQNVIVALTTGEFMLMRALLERPQRILTRDELLDVARGPDAESFDRAIDVQISRLRRKLEDGADGHGALIRTVRNEGYMFDTAVVWR
jgi:two-component system, OmpR family, response regulator